MQVQPYLFFEGRCEEAIDFYRRTLGAETLMLMRYKDMPEPRPAGTVTPENENKVMHATLRIGDSTLLVSDGQCQGTSEFQGLLAHRIGPRRGGGGPVVQRAGRGRHGADADCQDVLLAALRHGLRPLRRGLDGDRAAGLTTTGRGQPRRARSPYQGIATAIS